MFFFFLHPIQSDTFTGEVLSQEQVEAKALCVLRPLRVTITNWDGADEVLEADGLIENST